ncbi:MAG TPA: hypothetical protein VIG64_04030 [Actinomycetota bacterium]|jgi:uncharacterized membrane protein
MSPSRRSLLSALAVTLGAALVVYPVVRTSELSGITAIGFVGVVFLALALTLSRARALALVGVTLVGLHYPLALHASHLGLDVYSVLVAVGLFVLYETADLSIGLADVAPATRPALARRAMTTLMTASAGALLSVLAILAGSLFSSGVTGIVVGAVCALGLVTIPIWMVQQRQG